MKVFFVLIPSSIKRLICSQLLVPKLQLQEMYHVRILPVMLEYPDDSPVIRHEDTRFPMDGKAEDFARRSLSLITIPPLDGARFIISASSL